MICVITLYVVSWIWSWIVRNNEETFISNLKVKRHRNPTPNRNGTKSPNIIPDEDKLKTKPN